MFKGAEDAYRYLKGNQKYGEYRKSAVDSIVQNSYVSLLFLNECEYDIHERELVLKSILKQPDTSYLFFTSNFKTSAEFKVLIEALVVNPFYISMVIENVQLDLRQTEMLVEVVCMSNSKESAQVCLQKLHPLVEDQIDRLQAVVVMNVMVGED